MNLLDYVFIDENNYRPPTTVDKLRPPNEDEWQLQLCPADGNCFYHALSMSTTKNKSPFKIRKDMLKYIDKHDCKISNILQVKERIISGLRAEQENVEMSAESWANHEEIQICAKMYDIVICVWNSGYKMWTACFPSHDTDILSNCRRAIYVYNDGTHFNLLTRKKAHKVCSRDELMQ